MKDLLKKTLEREVSHLLKLHAEEDAYYEFADYLKSNPELSNHFDSSEINEIFPKPISINAHVDIEVNEEGDLTTGSEYTDSDCYSLRDLKDFGWLSDSNLRQSILDNRFYRNVVFQSIGDMPFDVKNEIEIHSAHILGRCNNPNDWGENRQGLVYGMVQSGKTASMMTLIGQAKSAGYRIFIVLSGDKESLRNQTQKRINEAFDLNINGWSRDSRHKIRSITALRSDYSEVARNTSNGLDLWPVSDKEQTIIICIKKQKDNLSKLLTHLKEIESQCTPTGRANGLSFESDFKTLILDDEADFASQDTTTGAGTRIHNLLCELRAVLKQNCYVAYTATPQACIGANPERLIGYPKDFVWLLDPHRLRSGETSSYLGLEEFFVKFPKDLIETLNDDAWPHIRKEEGVRLGIYKPGEDELVQERLVAVESDHVEKLIRNQLDRDRFCGDFKLAIVDYLVGCSIRWHRHYIKCKADNFFTDRYPITSEIEEIECPNSKVTVKGYKPFPYHAMMFNLAYINDSHGSILRLIDILWNEIKIQWEITVREKWNRVTLFTDLLRRQEIKSMRFESIVPSCNELENFIESAIKITEKLIYNKDKYIYLLNSQDEGSVLQYESSSQDIRPKKASIIVGGNILSRGLTIENLSVTVFARSQVMSLGDTNLQMCRWFGHKKKDIDITTVYMQNHSLELFQSISEADKELRSQFKYHIYNNIPNKCLLLSLFNSPLFQNTSPSKMRNSSRAEQSYSGITVDVFQHTQHLSFLENNKLLDDYLGLLKQSVTGRKAFERATVYENVPIDDFLKFFRGLNFSDDALNISPSKYIKYLVKWNELRDYPLPNFNVAVFDVYDNGNLRKRARKIHSSSSDFLSEQDFKDAATNSLAPFRGGKSDKSSSVKYCGDHLVDFTAEYHDTNYDKTSLRREKGKPILFLFYRIHANYVGSYKFPNTNSKKEVYFAPGDKLYIDVPANFPLITFSVATPLGGLVFETRINNAVAEIVKANTAECEKYFQEIS
jgi:hypothetical protein